jgi:LacI family transcriptional regulator
MERDMTTPKLPLASKPVPDTGPATIAAVASRAGVSIATVSRVMNGIAKKASSETIERVRLAVDELGYRPGSAGRTLRHGKSRLVAVLAANMANPTMAAIAATAESAFRERGLVMVLCDTHDRADLQDEYLLEMRAQRARVTVLLGAVKSAGLTQMYSRGEPLLFVNRRSPDDLAAPFVGIDNYAAATEVAEALGKATLGPLALLHGHTWSSATGARIDGFMRRAHELGRPVAQDHIFGGGGDHLDIGYRGADALLKTSPRPKAIFCTSDLMAYGAHRRLSEAGISVPRDMVVCGFDDNPLNDWVAPWLWSVRVPYAAFGPAISEAALAVSDKSDVAPCLVLPHALVRRSGLERVGAKSANEPGAGLSS